jgi:aspartyl-tRNA(Asn)/glutamyl-tRNA(Gln) amidotransferase subunit B
MFRCAAPGAPLGTRREIKNLNSFRFLQQAIDYEVQWQINELEEGRAIEQATVLFDPDTGETRAMRTKEEAHDYRYFPDPDLLPLEIRPEWIEEVRAGLPELPQAMQARFQTDFGLTAYDAATLTASRALARYFEDAVAVAGKENAKLCANWVMGELAARLNKTELPIEAAPIQARQLAGMIRRIADGTLSSKLAKEVFDALWNGAGEDADAIIAARGLKQLSDASMIEPIIDQVIDANPKSVEEFRAGKEKAFNALVGQVMKATQGKANPQQVNELLRKKLGAR